MINSRFKYVHPFPARMAPEISNTAAASLPPESRLLDPMCGSGSVLRAGVERGIDVIGVDIDPLAVLMAQVWTTRIDPARMLHDAHLVLKYARSLEGEEDPLPWQDDETRGFVSYWFAEKQVAQLTAISRALTLLDVPSVKVLKVALSRIIISKDRGASLARDVSHSRPHRAWLENDYDVYDGFLRSCRALVSRISPELIFGRSNVHQGDCRNLHLVASESVDAIISSPPYLNALDYLRGHRLSLVWLGFSVAQIRRLRSYSVGSERGGTTDLDVDQYVAGGDNGRLPRRQLGWVARFLNDANATVREMARVLRPGAPTVLVIGDSFLRGCKVRNAQMFEDLLVARGFEIVSRVNREIPNQNRYLPPPSGSSALATRMRLEVVLEGIAPRRPTMRSVKCS